MKNTNIQGHIGSEAFNYAQSQIEQGFVDLANKKYNF